MLLAAATWKDVAIELVKQLAAIIGAVAALVWAFRRYVKPKIDQLAAKQDVSLANQARLEAKANVIEEKADGNHKAALEEIKKAGKYEGKEEAKHDARYDREQLHAARRAGDSRAVQAARAPQIGSDVSITHPAQITEVTGGVSRSLADKLGEIVSVKDYGAKGDNATDDTTAIQNAADAAAIAHKRLQLSDGTYLVSTPISIAPTFFGGAIVGENVNAVTIKATAAMAAVFQFTDVTANGGFTFADFTIDGNHLAQKGIASTQLRYTRYDRLIIKGTTVAAIDVSQSWDTNITVCQLQNNDGDAIRLGANANNVLVRGNVVSTNGGWGITAQSGSGVNLYNNDISSNALGGIYVVSGAGTAGAGTVNIKDNYFEGNATTAITVTLTSGSPSATASAAAVAIAAANVGKAITGSGIPAATTISSASGTTITLSANATASQASTAYVSVGITISAVVMKTDMLLNGSADPAVLSASFPISNANVEGNNSTSYGATTFVSHTGSAVTSLRMVGNTHLTAYSLVSQIPFVSVLNPGALTAMIIEGNVGFTGHNNIGDHFHDRLATAPSGGTVTIDLAVAEEWVISPATNATFTIASPANQFWTTSRPAYKYITIRVRNGLGGGGALGAITWGAKYKMAAWTNPADGFSRSITFAYDLAADAYVEISRTPADVPN